MDWTQFLELVAIPAFVGVVAMIWKMNDGTRQSIADLRAGLNAEFARASTDIQEDFDRLESDLKAFRDRAHKRLDEAHEACADVRKYVDAWQLEIVRTYATKHELERTDQRMMQRLERIETKLDGLIQALVNDRAN